ncbi:LacI family DNA-binding transcriptional regulator [Edwardsiella piscicida]|nr:LacI family DNA-binding transcriptional regulator [Edwardsiella piscicida]ELM3729805.1 LacI family DNA-binding transcriptional regulator [Edwardsiella piscicida]ELV7537254.1 LacI family DNA-binding transcriptional regulator [Edwardsiella piscicida]
MEIDHKLNKKLKIAEIAARTGLSASTVSRVLAGKANTSEKARNRVLTCARELGVMDGMAAGRMLLNSLVVFAPQRAFDERSDIFYYRVIQSINKALSAHEVRLRYCALEEEDSDAELFLARMNEPGTQAAILLGIDDARIHRLAADGAQPCVLINCRDEQMRLPSIAPDHRLIGQCAARYLFEMGHRAVMNVMCLRRYTMDLRLVGIKAAWRAQNLRFLSARDLIALSIFSAREAEERVGGWLDAQRGKPLPTAFLVGGDFMAAGTITALRQRGLRVPQDVSVMSIDGFNLAAIQDVPLTAVHVPRDALGSEAVQMLQQRLLRPRAPCGSLLLYGELVVRASVRRIRPGNRRGEVSSEGLYDDR